MNLPDATSPCTKQYCSPNTPGDTSCGGKGECSESEQKCVCEKGFWGVGCQDSLCTPNCDHGSCHKIEGADKGLCVCNRGFAGPACDVAYCGDDAACSAHGKCDHGTQSCACDNGYRGHFCEIAYCGVDAACTGHGTCD